MKRRSLMLVLLLVGGVIVATAIILLVDVIPPVDATRTSIIETSVRIRLYADRYGQLPNSLEVLPKREGYANSITDGWGRKLVYSVGSNGIVSLKSLGRDGKPGGSGEDADIEVQYQTHREHGQIAVEGPEWPATSRMQTKP